MPVEILKPLFTTTEPPQLGPARRSGTLTAREVHEALQRIPEVSSLLPGRRELIESACLLWHDHLDESHTLSQSIHNADGSFLHGLMHRREPDYGNAKYWFHRVGAHASYPEIARRIATLAAASPNSPEIMVLIPGARWDAFAMVDACERALKRGSEAEQRRLREVQRIELEVLLERWLEDAAR